MEKDFGKMIDKALGAISSDEEKARVEADKEAMKLGIERLTLINDAGNNLLIVKPNELMKFWLVNLFDQGSINVEEPEFEANEIAGTRYRLIIKTDSLNYFVDLKDERQLLKAAEFLGVEIKDPTKA